MKGPAASLDAARIARLRRLGGEELVKRLVDLFLDAVPARLAAARAALAAGDRRGLARAVHSLVSSAGNLGATGLERLSREIEGRAAGDPPESLEALLAVMEEAFEGLRPLLREVRG